MNCELHLAISLTFLKQTFTLNSIQGHLPGDKWKVDSCTTCTCRNDSTIFCSKTSCPTKPICGLGFVAVKAPSTDECCEKYVCVAEVARSVSQTACPQLNIPKCSNDQTNKMINDTNGCSKFICGKSFSVLF